MKFPCVLTRLSTGRWTIRHEGQQLGRVEATASTRTEAIEKIRGELRYHLELCPCTGESYQHIDVEVVEQAGVERPPK